jgi:predicted nucleic acid-binding protein
MRDFFDTSVLIAAFWRGHAQHEASLRIFAGASKEHSACGLHTLAEVYASMSALPVKPMIPAEQAFLFVAEVHQRLTVVSLREREYLATIRKASEQGQTGGRIYDALLLACAANCQAQRIYTLNVTHFQAIAPHLAHCFRTP